LPALRTIPNLTVIRPADATETAEAWRVALETKHGPVALLLTRQKLVTLDRDELAPAENLARGAYVLSDADGQPDLILIASGSEVELVLAASRDLAERGIKVRVVSMPSWELFEKQPLEYQNQVLPPEVEARLAVEAAAPMGWDRYVGDKGKVIGVNGFGASAPYKILWEKYGFTVENVVAQSAALLEKNQ
jgi:transketolase